MGMFDNVRYEAPCPSCGVSIGPDQWQSKDGPCTLSTIPVSEVNRFYAICPNCKAWVDGMVRKMVTGVELTARSEKEWLKPIVLEGEANGKQVAPANKPNRRKKKVG